MRKRILTLGSRLTCPHGAPLEFMRGAGPASCGGHAPLTVDDLLNATISGCPLPTKPCTKVLRVIDPGWRGGKVSQKTPVLESVVALTDAGPPGLCVVMDPGPPGAVHEAIGGLIRATDAPAPADGAPRSAPRDPDGATPLRLRLRIDASSLDVSPGTREAFPAAIKVFLTIVEGASVASIERTIATNGAPIDVEIDRTSGLDAWVLVATEPFFGHGVGEFVPEGVPAPCVVVPRDGRGSPVRFSAGRRPRTYVATYDEAVRLAATPRLDWRILARANGLPGRDARRELPPWVLLRVPIRTVASERERTLVLRPAYPALLRLALALRGLTRSLEGARARFLRPGLLERVTLARLCQKYGSLRRTFAWPDQVGLYLRTPGPGPDADPPMYHVLLRLHDEFRRKVAGGLLSACAAVRDALGEAGDNFTPLVTDYNQYVASSPAPLAFAEPADVPEAARALAPLIAMTEQNEAVRLLLDAQDSLASALAFVGELECLGSHCELITPEERAAWLPWLDAARKTLQVDGVEVGPRPDPLRGWMLLKALIAGVIKVSKGPRETGAMAKAVEPLRVHLPLAASLPSGVGRGLLPGKGGPVLELGAVVDGRWRVDPDVGRILAGARPDPVKLRKEMGLSVASFALLPLTAAHVVQTWTKGPGNHPSDFDVLVFVRDLFADGVSLATVVADGAAAFYKLRLSRVAGKGAAELTPADLDALLQFDRLQRGWARAASVLGGIGKVADTLGTLNDARIDIDEGDSERIVLEVLKLALLIAPRLARLPAWPILVGEVLVALLLEETKMSDDEKVLAAAFRQSEFGREGIDRARRSVEFRRAAWEEAYYDWPDEHGRTEADLLRVRETLGAQAWSLRRLRATSGVGREWVDGLTIGFQPRPEVAWIARARLEQTRISGIRRPLEIAAEITQLSADGGVILTLHVAGDGPVSWVEVPYTDRRELARAGDHIVSFVDDDRGHRVVILRLARDMPAGVRAAGIPVPPGKPVEIVLLPLEIPHVTNSPSVSEARGESGVLRIRSLAQPPAVFVEDRQPATGHELMHEVYGAAGLSSVVFVTASSVFSPPLER